MAELDSAWINRFDHIRQLCRVKGMQMPTRAWSISESGEIGVVELPEKGDPRLISGILTGDTTNIVVADPAEKLPFLFTNSVCQLHWHRPAEHAFKEQARPPLAKQSLGERLRYRFARLREGHA